MGRRSGDSSGRRRQMLASTERKRCLAKRRATVWVLPRVIMRTGVRGRGLAWDVSPCAKSGSCHGWRDDQRGQSVTPGCLLRYLLQSVAHNYSALTSMK